MAVRLSPRFRPAVGRVRLLLAEPERGLFDLLCAAGELAWRLPDDNVNVRLIGGSRDPRRRLARDLPFYRGRVGPRERAAARRLAATLTDLLSREPLDEQTRSLRVLMAMAPAGLAPDCREPRAARPRLAWTTVLRVFGNLFPSRMVTLDPIPRVGPRRLAALRAEALEHLPIGRRASGRRPGAAGVALAVDRRFIAAVGRALGRELSPGYSARLLYYTDPGDYVWPHPDDPKYAVNVLVCLDAARAPGARRGSAFLAYPPGRARARHELAPGTALAVESCGLVHAREPLVAGERVVLLSILLCGRAR